MPKPPGDPDAFDKVNYVINAWARPCDAPWYIYVSTLKPAALEAFITLMTFGWDDVARGYLRPRGLGGRRTGKRKGKWGRRVPRFPEIGELIGSNLPGAEAVKGARWNILGKALWRIDTAIQQALFWWLVADVTVDFAFNWTSVLYETRWCQASSLGRFSAHTTENNISPPNFWTRIHYDVQDYEFSPPSWSHVTGHTGANSCLVAATCTLDPGLGNPPPTEVTIRIALDVPRTPILQEGPAAPTFPDDVTTLVAGDVPPNTTFLVQVMHNGPPCRITAGIVTAMENQN